jgi:UDPglucose 6-dehydrogenase
MWEAPSLTIINLLHEMGAQVRAHDPEAKKHFGDQISYSSNRSTLKQGFRLEVMR